MFTVDQLTHRGDGCLPGLLGVVCTNAGPGEIHLQLQVKPELMAPNGYLHAATVVALADTSTGYGCFSNLPEGATGFTTVELKSNHVGTARDGTIKSVAKPVHRGRNTQVWDAMVTHLETGKTIAMFRCTQMILYAKQAL